MGSNLSFPHVQLHEDRTFLITGGNTGIGYETAKQIAMMGGHVIIACRNEDKAKAAISKMQEEFEAAKKQGKANLTSRDQLNVENMRVDLSSLNSTIDFINKVKVACTKLHVLICNAGIGFAPRSYTEDQYESMFQVNYLSQFLIAAHLLPLMRRSGDDCRLVLVSSIAHKFGSFDLRTAQAKDVTNFNRMKYYGNSKMYQIMQMYSMVKRLQGSHVSVSSLHPGVVDSELARNFQDRFYYKHIYTVGRLFGGVRNLYQGAATSINCAVNPELRGVTGVYYVDAKPSTSSRESRNTAYQDELWEYTLKCLKDYLPADVLVGLEGQTTAT